MGALMKGIITPYTHPEELALMAHRRAEAQTEIAAMAGSRAARLQHQERAAQAYDQLSRLMARIERENAPERLAA